MRKGMRRMKTRYGIRVLILLWAMCLALGACGGEESSPVAVGDSYRDFTAVLADGSTFTLSDHEGSVILLNFWATWCGSCVGEMPAFPRLVEKYGDDLTLIAVNLGEDEETVKEFLEDKGYDFSVALDPEEAVGGLYPTDGIPYTVLIGRDGKIASIHLGAGGADAMFELYCGEIDELLKIGDRNEFCIARCG